MNQETIDKLRAAGREDLIKIHEINQSGYAGILPSGQIVDRREHPNAVPVPENKMLGIPHAKFDDVAKKPCPEFPYFGASYPDATCVDGFLWDLDMCDENGLYSSGENPPCPFCNTELFIEQNLDEESGTTREWLTNHIETLKSKYA